jgi:hypothetical protein
VNAATFVQNRDPEEATGIYRQAYRLEPANAEVLEGYGAFLATAAEDSLAYQAAVRRGYWITIDFGRSQAARLKEELENSPDSALLSAAAHDLVKKNADGRRVFGHDPDARRFGESLFDRAIRLDPANPRWRSMRLDAERVAELPKKGVFTDFTLFASHSRKVQVTPMELEDHLLKAPAAHPSLLARWFHQTGDVRFQVTVEGGQVRSGRILSGNSWLRGSAARALKDWQFALFFRDGQMTTVTSEVTVPVATP